MRYKKTAGILFAAAIAVTSVSAGVEAAQEHRGRSERHDVVRPSVRPYYYYRPYRGFYYGPFYRPWYDPWYYSYYGPPYNARPYYDDGALRIQVKPVETEVYVDGYYAGEVDDFDGIFQRLHLEPGEHEVELYLEGHKILRKSLYLSRGSTQKIQAVMEPLGPGEAGPARPGPAETSEASETLEEGS